MFYINLFVTNLLMIQICMKWEKLMMDIGRIEADIFKRYPCYKNLKKTITITAIVFFLLALCVKILP